MVKLLFVDNVAGTMTEIRKELIKNNYECAIVGPEYDFGFHIDYKIKRRFKNKFLNGAYWRLMAIKYVIGSDIIHFNSLLFPYLPLDLILWRLLGKKIIVHRHGTDIRGKKESRLVEFLAHKILVSTPDLLKYTPKAEWLPNPIDLKKVSYVGPSKNEKVTIIHAPSNRKKKGTEYVINTIDMLKKKHDIEFVLVEEVSHKKALEIYKKADIAIDHIGHDWYGSCTYGCFSIEMMAMGKPTAAYIKPDLYSPRPPMISINKDNAHGKIEDLILHPEKRESIGLKSRKYVERVHDKKKVAKRYLEIIKEICGQTSTLDS